MRVKTGIARLDSLLGGGLPERASILVEGPTGAGKSMFCKEFIIPRGNESSIYVTLNSSPEEIKEDLKRLGCKNIDRVKFLDAYSWQIGKREEKYVVNPVDLTSFTVKLTKLAIELSPFNLKKVVIDSFSTLFLFVPKDLCLRFLSVITAKLKSFGTTQLIVIEEGMHDDAVLAALNALTDGTIRITRENGTHVMEIPRMKETGNLPLKLRFAITDKGIEVVDHAVQQKANTARRVRKK